MYLPLLLKEVEKEQDLERKKQLLIEHQSKELKDLLWFYKNKQIIYPEKAEFNDFKRIKNLNYDLMNEQLLLYIHTHNGNFFKFLSQCDFIAGDVYKRIVENDLDLGVPLRFINNLIGRKYFKILYPKEEINYFIHIFKYNDKFIFRYKYKMYYDNFIKTFLKIPLKNFYITGFYKKKKFYIYSFITNEQESVSLQTLKNFSNYKNSYLKETILYTL